MRSGRGGVWGTMAEKGPERCQQGCIWGREVQEDWWGCKAGLKPVVF